jgi:DNA-binding Lrp family transcriptional regulator
MGRNKSIDIKSLPQSSVDNGVFDVSSPMYVLKLLDGVNVKIISELVRQPDISSLTLSKKLDIPLSTLQRRRSRIEKAILKKTYTFNYKSFGGRVGDLIIAVDKGKSKEVAQTLLKRYENNVVSCETRINSMHNVSAHVVYQNTEELYELIESIKTMEYVTGVSWSEVVELIGDNNSEVISGFFNSKRLV